MLRLKTALVQLSVWGASRLRCIRPTLDGRSGRVRWPVILMLAVIGLALLWQWDAVSTRLFSTSKHLLHSVERKLSLPQRNPDGFYQDERMVALGEGMIGNIGLDKFACDL